MAPFDSNWSPSLINKVSTQIDGQLPEFIAADHPNFSNFLKSYYKYLESGELRLTVDIDNVLLELDTASNLLREDGGLIVTESGAGTTGKFVAAETITGGTSNATAEVLVEDLGHATKPRLFITSQQKFETGETVTDTLSILYSLESDTLTFSQEKNPCESYADENECFEQFELNFGLAENSITDLGLTSTMAFTKSSAGKRRQLTSKQPAYWFGRSNFFKDLHSKR